MVSAGEGLWCGSSVLRAGPWVPGVAPEGEKQPWAQQNSNSLSPCANPRPLVCAIIMLLLQQVLSWARQLVSPAQIQQVQSQRERAKGRFHIPPPSPVGTPAKWCTPCLVSGGSATKLNSWVAPFLSATFLGVGAPDSGWSRPILGTTLSQPGVASSAIGQTTSQYSSEAGPGTGALFPPPPCPSHQQITQSHRELKTGCISQGFWRPSCFWFPFLPSLLFQVSVLLRGRSSTWHSLPDLYLEFCPTLRPRLPEI